MNTTSQRRKRRDTTLSSLNAAIDVVNIAKDALGMTPAKAALGFVDVILVMIRDSMINEEEYVNLALACADVCKALGRGMNGRRVGELGRSVLEAIEHLTTTVAEIQRNVIRRGKRNAVSRLFHVKNDKEAISTWRLDLNRILHVFNTELAINTNVVISDVRRDIANARTIVSDVHQGVSELQHNVINTYTIVSDIHRTMVEGRERTDGEHWWVQASIPGESPPPPPRACFGRDGLIEGIVGLAENLTPIALIGPGGIGKTSIALTVLGDYRIKQRFGDNRWFIRCDQISASRSHFLSRLSKVIGAGVENPGDLSSLRRFLSSREMILFLDNAESVLDSQGGNAQEIYAIVEELSRFSNISLCITSRISIIPSDCKRLDIPTLSMDPACHTFYHIYDRDERSDLINNILEQLDFHPLSITLLATVAQHNEWDTNRLTKEWARRRTGVLRTQYNESLATTIELSLASPMFQGLGPDARDLLGIVAFFPQGVDEKNLDWFFPAISDRTNIFDKFCVLSLAYRNNGFITMLAPLRDHLCPKDPKSSPLLRMTKDHYFQRLSVGFCPDEFGSGGAQWIRSEDVNVEHLLDVFTSIDGNSISVWDACACFMRSLYWNKKRLVTLGPKIEDLPDDHPSKPECLFQLSWSFNSVGNYTEEKRHAISALKLWRERGSDLQVARTLWSLSNTNRLLGLYKEGIQRTKEALEIYERFGDISGQVQSLYNLASLLHDDGQLDAAEEAAARAIDLLPDGGEQFRACRCHRVLGEIFSSKGEAEKAINHFETALGIASSFNWYCQLLRIHHSMAELLFDENRFDDAHTHVERAKLHAIDDTYRLGHAMELQAEFLYQQHKFEEAKSEALQAVEVYEKIGATNRVEACRVILRNIEAKMEKLVTSDESDFNARTIRYNFMRPSRRIPP